MIRRAADMVSEVRENMRGGDGAVTIQHYFTKDEVSKLLESTGFVVESVYGNLWEEPYTSDGEWIGLYSVRA